MFDELVAALKAIDGLPFAEYGWNTRPEGCYGTVQIDFGAGDDIGDDCKQDSSYEGSVDLFTAGKRMDLVRAVEDALTGVCGGSWELNSEQYEHETGLVHREYVFQLETR